MIASILASFARMPWNPRGKHRLLRAWDSIFGLTRCFTKEGIQLDCRLSSIQDMSFLGENASYDELRDLIQALPEGGVFVDVGANVGYVSLLASRAVGAGGCVVAIEPSRQEFQRLLGHIEINEARPIVALNCAGGVAVTLATLQVDDVHTGLHRLVGSGEETGQAYSVVILPLDVVLPAIIGERVIDLMKIDVEGAEMEVLMGCRTLLAEQRIRSLFVEITDEFLRRRHYSRRDVYSLMATYGYDPEVGERDAFQYDEVFRCRLPKAGKGGVAEGGH